MAEGVVRGMARIVRRPVDSGGRVVPISTAASWLVLTVRHGDLPPAPSETRTLAVLKTLFDKLHVVVVTRWRASAGAAVR